MVDPFPIWAHLSQACVCVWERACTRVCPVCSGMWKCPHRAGWSLPMLNTQIFHLSLMNSCANSLAPYCHNKQQEWIWFHILVWGTFGVSASQGGLPRHPSPDKIHFHAWVDGQWSLELTVIPSLPGKWMTKYLLPSPCAQRPSMVCSFSDCLGLQWLGQDWWILSFPVSHHLSVSFHLCPFSRFSMPVSILIDVIVQSTFKSCWYIYQVLRYSQLPCFLHKLIF